MKFNKEVQKMKKNNNLKYWKWNFNMSNKNVPEKYNNSEGVPNIKP